MKKIVVILFAIAFMPIVSFGTNDNDNTKSRKSIEEVKSTNSKVVRTNDEDWTPIGTTEILKKIGVSASANRTVQVYKNSAGVRAIKDKKFGYQEIKENKMYNRFPADECFECGYGYQVFFEGDIWYTKGIVKKTLGSY